MPDTLLVVRAYLLGVPEVAAIVADRIRVNATDDRWPSIRLTEMTGVEIVPRRLDRVLVQADCWAAPADPTVAGSGDFAAQHLARTVRAALVDIGGFQHSTAFVSGADAGTGIRHMPDESREPPVPRWVVSAAIFIRPEP